MTRPKLLDLFCGAGGCSMGYHRAGFDVVGVDIKPMPRYPFEFVQCDWEEALAIMPGLWERDGIEYVIHASPPCQRYSTMTKKWNRQNDHPDLLAPCREALREIGVHYVIENVPGAPLESPIMLCGSMFNLDVFVCGCGVAVSDAAGRYGCANCNGEESKNGKRYYLRRHRLFESSLMLLAPAARCVHRGQSLPVYGHAGGTSKRDGLKFPGTDAWRLGMGIDWMTGNELAESIPPAYTEFIGKQLLAVLQRDAA